METAALTMTAIFVVGVFFMVVSYVLWRRKEHCKELAGEETEIAPKHTYNKYKTRPEQQELWTILTKHPDNMQEVFAVVPRQYGKDVLIAKRALEGTNSLIITPDRFVAQNLAKQLKLISRDAGVDITLTQAAEGYVASFKDGSVTITWPLALDAVCNRANMTDFLYDFVCFNEAGIITTASIQGKWIRLTDSAMLLCIGTAVSRGSVFAGLYIASKNPICYHFAGPLPNLSNSEVVYLKKALSPRTFARDIISVWPMWLCIPG